MAFGISASIPPCLAAARFAARYCRYRNRRPWHCWAWELALRCGGCGRGADRLRSRRGTEGLYLRLVTAPDGRVSPAHGARYGFFFPKRFDQTDLDSLWRCWTFNWPRMDCRPMEILCHWF